MEILKLIKNRIAARKYKDKPIPNRILDKIIEAGRWGPSVHGFQPWRFIAITKVSLIKEISNVLLNKSEELGSGIEIILTLLLLKNISGESKGSLVYLIDEPELHLHPKAQEKLIELLIQESSSKQIILSTQSPFLFKNCLSHDIGIMILTKGENNKIDISLAKNKGWGTLPWSPSWGEINYLAYDLPTVEFHNELYGYLQEKEQKYTEPEVESYLTIKSVIKSKQWIRIINGTPQQPYDVTLCTYVRNSIHHRSEERRVGKECRSRWSPYH